MRRLDPRGRVGGTRVLRCERPGTRYGAGHQHVADALMAEVAIGEAHAGYRALKAALVLLDEVEARLEGDALERSADRLSADLQRVAGKPDMAHRAGA